VESGPVEIVGVTKYYHFGGQRVAMRQGDVVYYLHGDHLGSVSLTTDSAGTVVAERRYLPYGQVRWSSRAAMTDFGFTGQRNDSFGLMDYKARYYDPFLGRFISADTVVPELGNPQNFNRFAYVLGNPVKYVDPDGRTVRSALSLIREHRVGIKSIAAQYDLNPVLLAGVVFAENRNDYNWIRGQDWSSFLTLSLVGGPEVKNLVSPLVKDNPSIGITEVSVAVAAMMDNPNLVP
jgi:RHS repeat-associated protein